jgi:hypothetical protein
MVLVELVGLMVQLFWTIWGCGVMVTVGHMVCLVCAFFAVVICMAWMVKKLLTETISAVLAGLRIGWRKGSAEKPKK